MIFAGIWYGTLKPDMTLFLKPVANALSRLFLEGRLINLANTVIK